MRCESFLRPLGGLGRLLGFNNLYAIPSIQMFKVLRCGVKVDGSQCSKRCDYWQLK